jgi:SAM-dependent methyltransferase
MAEADPQGLEARLARLEANYELLKNFAVGGVWHALNRLYTSDAAPRRLSCLACGRLVDRRSAEVRRSDCVFGGGPIERLVCPSCGCVFGPLSLLDAPAEWIAADYRLLYAFYSEADSTEEEVRAFEALDPAPGGVYLNWGAGAWSRSVEVLRSRGYDVWGYEPNAAVARPYVVGRREEVSALFDGIFSNNVIEHFIDPAAQFRDFAGLLKPGGRMAHASPCYEWSFDFTRFHVFFPLGDSVAALARRTGFRLIGREDDGDFRVRIFAPT